LRVHVDQPHLDRREWIREFALAAIALVAEPRGLRAPVDRLWLPDVLATAAEAECLEAHRFERDVASEDHQVRPRQPAAVFLLDRPEQPTRLVEVAVVGPAVEWREALLARACAATAIKNSVRASGVPRHADEERTVVAVVGGPPVLRIGHQRVQVRDHRVEVELLELGRVVVVLDHRIGKLGMLVEHPEVHLVGPPVGIGTRLLRLVCNGALRLGIHGSAPSTLRAGHVAWAARQGNAILRSAVNHTLDRPHLNVSSAVDLRHPPGAIAIHCIVITALP